MVESREQIEMHLDPRVVVMIEGAGCPTEWRGLSPGHLTDVQGLVLVVQVLVALVAHCGDVVHAALLGYEGEEGPIGNPVVVQGVDSLPVPLCLGGGVLIVQDQPEEGRGEWG